MVEEPLTAAAKRAPSACELAQPGAGPFFQSFSDSFAQLLRLRALQHSGAVRAQLEHRAEQVEAALAQHAQALPIDSPPRSHEAQSQRSPLAVLNATWVQRQRPACSTGQSTAQSAGLAAPRELESVRRFRSTWLKVSAEQQLAQSLAQAPANAGPLNSQRLVLQSLALMRRLSPEYLRHFLAQADVWMWLQDQAVARARGAPKKRK